MDEDPKAAKATPRSSSGGLWLWPALLFAPTLFLTQLTLNYALIDWACRSQQPAILHLVPGLSFALTLVTLALARADWRRSRRPGPTDAGNAAARSEFLALAGLALAALCSFGIVAQWAMQFAINPCL